jgi:hypothetical protein
MAASFHPRVLWSQQGEYARQILAQYNVMDYFGGYSFYGPHFVTWDRGEFFLKPFGAWSKHRYSFHCRPEFLPGHEEPLWTFVVM